MMSLYAADNRSNCCTRNWLLVKLARNNSYIVQLVHKERKMNQLSNLKHLFKVNKN